MEQLDLSKLNVGLTEHLGLRLDEITPDRVRMSFDIRPEHLQPFGIVHGGVYCSVVETAASMGAAAWLASTGTEGKVVGVSNQTDFLRALAEGSVAGVATPVHRGRSQQLWIVEITDAQQRLVARGQVRLQNLTN
ncbi:uncharacterized protein (TIGR00369 family) [Jatrophihabitans sp. GAS493]|uniref:PaaI family thioesterase n=1 Tax=Jatrophihabitans sp. GAS493 TaxID=1907575 RepID=UPI000BB76E1C|nr:PaaI family thioesterase [Jatrophihabitans sp. GAS493]SOD73951.1 uncharacterized protein (TIGR00369 family) [Jatrophihabitans sp. GAS493]